MRLANGKLWPIPICLDLNEKEIKIAKLIIGCIDESGELSESTEQIEEISNYIYSEKEIENILLNITPW